MTERERIMSYDYDEEAFQAREDHYRTEAADRKRERMRDDALDRLLNDVDLCDTVTCRVCGRTLDVDVVTCPCGALQHPF